MIRVLQVVNSADRGGAETMVMNLYRCINRDQVQFDFTNHTLNKAAYDDEIESLGGRILYLPKLKGYNYFKYVNAWRKLFENHPEYNIIHIHNYNIAGIVARIAKKQGVKIIIVHSHSTRLNLSIFKRVVFKFFHRALLKNTSERFACGQKAGEFLFGKRSFTILPNAIDTKKFLYNESNRKRLRNGLGIEDHIKIYGHVGSFRIPKNHSFLIDIYSRIHRYDKNSRLLLIGSGELLEDMKKKVNKLGLSDAVLFLGQQSNVNEWLSAFDVFLMPSLWEGLPVSVVEAQCAGLPCVISDIIDRGVDVTGAVKYISLNLPEDYWAREIISVKQFDRVILGKMVEDSGYNICSTVVWLHNFYVNSLT